MILDSPLAALGLLFLVAFLPSLWLALRLRNAERYGREPFRLLLKAFVWGGLGAAILATIAEASLLGRYGDALLLGVSVGTVIVAPIVEELAKGLGLLFLRDAEPEPENGYIYGAMIGLAFGAIENALYIGQAFVFQGQGEAAFLAVYRGIITVPLHAAATAMVGYGVWQAKYFGRPARLLVGVAAAIALHAAYNALADLDFVWSLAASAALALVAYWRIGRRVRKLDRLAALR